MLKIDEDELDEKERMYPDIKKQVYSFENADLPTCAHCGSEDTASVQIGLIGRTIFLASATTKLKLIANGPKPGEYFCNQCEAFFSK
jgi:hypothetical protein